MLHLSRPGLSSVLAFTLLAFAVGCADEPMDEAPPAEEPAAAPAGPVEVWFEEPQDGATVQGPDVQVVLGSSGIEIVPVEEGVQGTGHHHIFVNEDATPAGQVIPANVSGIIHLGDGSSEYVIEGLEPGEYRLITVLADLLHIPLDPPAHDTVHITVTE